MGSLARNAVAIALVALLAAGCESSRPATGVPGGTPAARDGSTARGLTQAPPNTIETATVVPPSAGSTATPSPTAAIGSDPEFDGDRAMAHVGELAASIGRRVAGTDGERRASDYIASVLSSYGYDVAVEPFTFQGFVDNGSRLTGADGRELQASTLAYSPAGDVIAGTAYAGLGRPGDFPSDIVGKIAVADRGILTFREKVQNAAAAGAVALIVVNNEPGLFQDSLGAPSAIPAVGVSEADGELLLQPAVARLHLRVDSQMGDIGSQNVVGRPDGGDCAVIVGAHYDSVSAGPGANDNASGVSVVLEIARALAVRGRSQAVCFVLFGAEEQGLHGSRAFVGSLDDAAKASIRLMVNFDMQGVGDTLSIIGDESALQVAVRSAAALGYEISRGRLPEGASSDHASFAEAGVPVLFFFRSADPNFHSAGDLPALVEPGSLEISGRLGLAVLAAPGVG